MTGAGGSLVVAAAYAESEEDGRKEETGPGGPDEAEGVGANVRFAVSAAEVIPGLNKGGGHERAGQGVEEEANEAEEAREGGPQTPAAGEEGREPGDGGEEEGD